MVLHDVARDSLEIWKTQNKEAITRALKDLLSRPHPKSNKGGAEFVPLTLLHYGEPVQAKLCYEAVVKSDDYSDVDSYIHGRISLFPMETSTQKQSLPADGISLRPQEIASLDAFIVPSRDSEHVVHARSFSSTHEDWQQHGIGKTLLIEGKEAFALNLIKSDPSLSHEVREVIFTIRDRSQGVGNVTLENWTTKVMNEWNASRPKNERYTQTAPDVFQKVVSLLK